MSPVSRCVFLAGILFAAATALGASAPGLDVVVTSGGSVAFEGITDAEGRFATTPLPPGIYTFEVRVPKTIGTESRYFLALSGAKPITQPLMRRDVAIMMDAQVRSARSVRGQVTARHVTIYTQPASTSPGANPASAPARVASAAAVRAPAASTAVPSSAGPAAYQQRVINGRLHVWEPLAPGSRLGRWVPEQPGRARAVTQPTSTAAQPPPAATPPQGARATAVPPSAVTRTTTPLSATPQRRIINGKWHVWQPAAPGSTLGRWLPEQPATTRASTPSSITRTNGPATPATVPTPAAVPRAVAVRAPAASQPATARPAAAQRRIINGKWHVWQPAAPDTTLGRWVPEPPRGARAVGQPAPASIPTPTPVRSGRSSSPRP